MKQKIRNYLITKIIEWIDVGNTRLNEGNIQKWMAETYAHPGFQSYTAKRLSEMKTALSGGRGMAALPRDEYVGGIGQRVELLLLAHKCKKAFEEERRKKNK